MPSFTGSTPFAVEVPCTYDLEVASAKYFDALDGRRRAAQLPLQRHRALPRRRRPAAGRARAVELLGALADAGRRVAAHDRRPLSRAAAGSGCSARRSRRSRGARPSAGCTRSTTRCGSCCERRAPALHAALRGLRALPVHAGRDQERHADAVRDRLPAGLRGRLAAHVRPRADAARARARRDGDRHARLPGGERRAAGRARSRRDGRVRLRERAGPRPARHDAARGRAGARGDVRPQHDRGPRGAGPRGALRSSLRSTHLVAHAPGGRFASPIAPGPDRRRGGGAVRPHQHLPGPGDATTTTRCSAPRSSCPTIRRSRPRATATCSTRRRSRRRCCCTCSRSATPSASRSPSRTRRCARCWRGPRPRGPRR